MSILQTQFLGNSVSAYIWAFVIFIAILIAIKIIKNISLRYLHKISKKTKNDFDDLIVDIIKNIHKITSVIIALYFSFPHIAMASYFKKGFHYALIIAMVYESVIALQTIIDYAIKNIITKKSGDGHAIKVFGLIVKVLVWVSALILILQNLGFNVSSLVAGLGIGGIAVALAIQNILGDLFSAFSMYVDKPFETGDFIIVGDQMGVVKKIGIKTTRITALQGEEIVIANQDLTSSRVQNFKKMQKRRIQFAIGVTYETPSEKLKKIPQIIEDIIKKTKFAEFDRAHFKDYGDFSLNYEIVYFVLTGDYNKYMDTQQEINLALFEVFAKEGIEFAYPTQLVYVKK